MIIISFFDFDEFIDNIPPRPDTLEVHVAANLSEGLCTLLGSAHWAVQSLVIATAPATNVQVLATWNLEQLFLFHSRQASPDERVGPPDLTCLAVSANTAVLLSCRLASLDLLRHTALSYTDTRVCHNNKLPSQQHLFHPRACA